jgi:hypothetical protein
MLMESGGNSAAEVIAGVAKREASTIAAAARDVTNSATDLFSFKGSSFVVISNCPQTAGRIGCCGEEAVKAGDKK